jgi:hypothetical protein
VLGVVALEYLVESPKDCLYHHLVVELREFLVLHPFLVGDPAAGDEPILDDLGQIVGRR